MRQVPLEGLDVCISKVRQQTGIKADPDSPHTIGPKGDHDFSSKEQLHATVIAHRVEGEVGTPEFSRDTEESTDPIVVTSDDEIGEGQMQVVAGDALDLRVDIVNARSARALGE